MNGDLFTIIFVLTVPFVAIYIGSKSKKNEKYNRGRPSCLDNSTPIKGKLMPKCSFCHKAATEEFPLESGINLKAQYFCSEECKKEIIEYMDVVNKNGMLFLGLIFGTIVFMVIASGIVAALKFDSRYGLLMTFIALAVVGAILIKFPYCTPETIKLIGIKKAKIIARCMGLVFIIGASVALIKLKLPLLLMLHSAH